MRGRRTLAPTSYLTPLNANGISRSTIRLRLWTLLGILWIAGPWIRSVRAQSTSQSRSDLIKQANAPISSIFQIRFQDSYAPAFQGKLHGQGNSFSIAVTMPLPKYRLLPFPQLSLITVPVATTIPLPTGTSTGFGDVRFLDLGIIDAAARYNLLFGIGPVFVFPTATETFTGQGKWQVGPAAAAAFAPEKWLVGVIAQNPISFAGDNTRSAANALFLQPFITYQLGHGWFVRSEPQMIFNWESNKQLLPVNIGLGRVFNIGPQIVNCFVEPAWNVAHDSPAPRYAITFGFALLYPDFWGPRASR